jgi:hypothetical protein
MAGRTTMIGTPAASLLRGEDWGEGTRRLRLSFGAVGLRPTMRRWSDPRTDLSRSASGTGVDLVQGDVQRSEYSFHHSVRIMRHITIAEANDAVAARLDCACPPVFASTGSTAAGHATQRPTWTKTSPLEKKCRPANVRETHVSLSDGICGIELTDRLALSRHSLSASELQIVGLRQSIQEIRPAPPND